MTEREFDIQVRNLLQQAEEPVSPGVWEDVSAGLDKRRRIIPVWFWRVGGSVAAAAAAIVALFVFLKPAAPVIEPAHSNPSIFMSEASGETVPPTEAAPVLEEAPVQVVQIPRSKPHLLAQTSEPTAPVAEAPAQPAPRQEPQAVVEEAPAVPEEAPRTSTVTEDNTLLNQLAFEAEKEDTRRGTRISLTAFGNIQGNQRGALQASFRRFGAPSRNLETGIYNESPEIGFNLPFSVGLGVQFNLSPNWAVGTGLRYTNLQRTFVADYKGEGFSVVQTDMDNQQHWLGVPVNVYYSFINTGRWRVHAFAGGSAEWLLDNHYLIHNSPQDIHYHQNGQRHLQWSAAAGLGLEFQLTPYLSLYTDPGFRYFFATDRQPRSLRTIQPLRFDVEAGLRFSFGK